MNQDQGKPSDRLFEAEKHGVFNPVVKGLFDEFHQRLVSAEAEIMNLNMRKLPHPDWLKQLELRVANLEIASIKSPTQEATKPECNKCNGTKMVASIPWGGEYQINPCPVCVPIPTPEPKKLVSMEDVIIKIDRVLSKDAPLSHEIKAALLELL